MLTAAAIFSKFKGTGMLFSASWTPAGGGAAAVFDVRLMKAGVAGLPMIGASEYAIQFVTAEAAGIAQGDTVTVNGKSYKLRDRDSANCSADGTLSAYLVREVVA